MKLIKLRTFFSSSILPVLFVVVWAKPAFPDDLSLLNKEACSEESAENDDLVTLMVESALNPLVEMIRETESGQPFFQRRQGNDTEEVMCKITDNLESELSCQVGGLGDDLTFSKVQAILSCIKDGSIHKTGSGWTVKGGTNLKIGRYIKLLWFEVAYSGPRTDETRALYRCQNTETGEMYTGTMKEIASEYNRYLKRSERK